MSSMIKHLIFTAILTGPAIAPVPAWAQTPQSSPQIIWRAGTGEDNPPANNAVPAAPLSAIDTSNGIIPAALQRWRMLNQPGNFSFNEYAGFLINHPNWPNAADMRKNAEQAINLNSYSPSQAVAYFDRLPPVTNGGRAKYADALRVAGDNAKAEEWGRKAWRGGALTDDDETRLFNWMAPKLTSADHDARADKLLWLSATRAAARILPLTSPSRRPLFAARLAVKTKAADADALIASAGGAINADAGILAELARQYRTQGDLWSAQTLLAGRAALAQAPEDAEQWYGLLLDIARNAQKDGQYDMAYKIASRLDDGLPPSIVVSDQPLAIRDDYTSLAWLAATTALYNLNRPSEAADNFARYGNAAKSPQTRTKGYYWAAVAAKRAGKAAMAQDYFEKAAADFDQFYGQLAIEALGRSLPSVVSAAALPGAPNNVETSVYQAAKFVGQSGYHKEQSLFLRAIANSAKSEQDYLNAIAFSKAIGRPDLSVMAGRNARVDRFANVIAYAFPAISVPYDHQDNFTLIHAIARQESQFDREAVSHAGARGLMQLIPSTARETARKISLDYNFAGLTSDPEYNIRLGSAYIKSMLNYYSGSYPLAIAAYNAGPGNVNKWLRANGDPRTGEIGILEWIEKIPLFETRNYVQRVLENAVIYDLQNPGKARIRSPNPLSAYLGKSTPG